MEKKKLLLVAVSVGVALLIIISIPLLIISPRQNPTTVSQAVAPPSAQKPVAVIEAPVLTPNPIQDNTQQIQPSLAADPEPPVNVNSTPPVAVDTPHVTTITVEPPRTVAVPTAPATPAQRPAPAARSSSTVRAAPERAAPERTTASAPRETARPAVARSTPAESSGRTTSSGNNNYWVQTGAFSTQGRAEGAKESLASKGITSVIENRDIDGKTWYRVRVGPYITETEANYWLALVKTIDGFGDSQVRQSPAALR